MAAARAAVSLVTGIGLIACAAKQPPAPPPAAPPPPALSEAPLSPTGTAMFAIGPIEDHRCEGRVYVEGTVLNNGSRPSREVKVWVEGRDAAGTRVARGEALPVPQEIPPGSRGRFLVQLPNDPSIRSFHVEAIGR